METRNIAGRIGQEAEPSLAAPAPDGPPTRYAWYVVGLLMAAYTLSFIDRKLPFILVESIKKDLSLTDTQIGLLTGVMFALVYSIAGVPLGRLSDRGSRKSILALAVLAWSGLTALGGFASNFWWLGASRAGVAAGEAVCTPAAHSMIADYVSPAYRARALGVYLVGGQLGILMGLSLGGLISDLANWRVAMWSLGIPGALLAALIWLTVKEPPRRADPPAVTAPSRQGMVEAIRLFAVHPVLRNLFLAITFASITSGAFQAFAPAYVMRSFGLTTSETGWTYGLVLGLAGMAGTLLGGMVGDRLRSGTPGRALRWVAVSVLGGALSLGAALIAPGYGIFLAFTFVMQAGALTSAGPAFATIQSIVPSRMHAMASAIYLFGGSGIGLSVGPLAAGLISDRLAGLAPGEALRLALLVLAVPNLIAALCFYRASRGLRAAAAAAR